MPRKQGRPALTPEEREERREERNQKARDERAAKRQRRFRENGSDALDDDDDEPRGRRARSVWFPAVIGALIAFAIVMLISAMRRKREQENDEIEITGLGAETIMVKRLDGKEESLQYWTVGITKHMGATFANMNAEHQELASRVNATERRLTELEKD